MRSPMPAERVIALIPARLESTRFPGKLMADLDGKSVILRTYESTVDSALFDDVVVVCGNQVLYDEITGHGGKAVLSTRVHDSGTDRIAEAAEDIDADIVVNVQGDEPFTRRAPLERLLAVFDGDTGHAVQVATLMQALDPESAANPNFVKIACDKEANALYFSRAPIPFLRDPGMQAVYYEHIGIYAFRRQALLDFTSLPKGTLEAVEKIECLRFLENGIPIRMVLTDYMGVEIDTPEDLDKANRLLN